MIGNRTDDKVAVEEPTLMGDIFTYMLINCIDNITLAYSVRLVCREANRSLMDKMRFIRRGLFKPDRNVVTIASELLGIDHPVKVTSELVCVNAFAVRPEMILFRVRGRTIDNWFIPRGNQIVPLRLRLSLLCIIKCVCYGMKSNIYDKTIDYLMRDLGEDEMWVMKYFIEEAEAMGKNMTAYDNIPRPSGIVPLELSIIGRMLYQNLLGVFDNLRLPTLFLYASHNVSASHIFLPNKRRVMVNGYDFGKRGRNLEPQGGWKPLTMIRVVNGKTYSPLCLCGKMKCPSECLVE
jgi:hypothetical protein